MGVPGSSARAHDGHVTPSQSQVQVQPWQGGQGGAAYVHGGLLVDHTAILSDHRAAVDAASEVLAEYMKAGLPVVPADVASAVGARLAEKGLPADMAARAAQGVARAVVQRLGARTGASHGSAVSLSGMSLQEVDEQAALLRQ